MPPVTALITSAPVPRAGRKRVEFILDSLLLVLLLLLFSPRLTGLPLHEWLGIAIVPPIVVHVLLSWRWIATATRRLLRGAPNRLRVNYILNAVLFVLLTLVIASGVAISEVAAPSVGTRTIDDLAWRALHNLTLNWLLLVAGFHIAMNWDWVRRTYRTMLSRDTPFLASARIVSVGRVGSRVLVIVTAAGAVAGAATVCLGAPSAARRYATNEIARFAGSPLRGVVQLTVETLLLCVAAYLGRKALRLRI